MIEAIGIRRLFCYTVFTIISQSMDSSFQSSLKSSSLFKDLDNRDIEELARLCVTAKFNKGETIFVPGEERGRIFLVVSGEVRVYQIAGGKKIVLEIYRPGGIFGDLSFAHQTLGRQRLDYAEALTREARLGIIDSGDFVNYLKQHPGLALSLLVYLRNRLHLAESKIRDLALSSADVRIINELIRYAVKFGREDGKYYEIPKRLTHQEISEMTGLARETVTKTFASLSRAGMIERSDTSVIRLNKEQILKKCLDCIKLSKPEIFA